MRLSQKDNEIHTRPAVRSEDLTEKGSESDDFEIERANEISKEMADYWKRPCHVFLLYPNRDYRNGGELVRIKRLSNRPERNRW